LISLDREHKDAPIILEKFCDDFLSPAGCNPDDQLILFDRISVSSALSNTFDAIRNRRPLDAPTVLLLTYVLSVRFMVN
jgi:hypothetical protein